MPSHPLATCPTSDTALMTPVELRPSPAMKGNQGEPSGDSDLHATFRGAGLQILGSGDTHIQGNVNISASSSNDPQVCRAIHFPPNDDFVQRSAISEQIEKLLPPRTEYQCAALWGLGGSGKTQLALDYAYRRCSDPACSVFWVHADSETSFAQDYKWIAKKLKLDDSLGGEELLTAVRNQIETLPQWVLVLDNTDDLGLFGIGQVPRAAGSSPNLSDYIPRGTVGTVLWTSRDQRIAGSLVGPRQGICVARMTDNEGAMLLETIRNLETREDEAGGIMHLLAELEFLPLAISQAAAYMRRTKLSITEYLDKIQERKKRRKVLRRSEPDRHRRPQVSNSVLETWNISTEYIRQESMMAYDILNVLAFVDSQNITFEMIAEVARSIKEDQCTDCSESNGDDSSSDDTRDSATDNSSSSESGSSDDEDEEEIVDAIVRLEEFSFLAPRVSEGSRRDRVYDMHKLVQEAILYKLHLEKGKYSAEARSAEMAFQITDNMFPESWDPETWNRCEQYLVHAQQTGDWAQLYAGEEAVSDLLSRVSVYLYDRGRWREREAVDIVALTLRENALGALHPDTIASRAQLAVTYQEQGRSTEAEKIEIEILQQRREILGGKHPDTIWSMGILAVTYHAQGRHNEAEELKIEVLQLRREVLGEKHPKTIRSMAELAVTYHAQGRYNEAEELKIEVLQLRREVLGEKHPDTIQSMAELATTYYAKSRYNEAEELHIEVLQLQHKVLGEKHPDTIRSMTELAATYYAQRRYNEDEELSIEALELRREALGEKHPDTIRSMGSLAATYYAQGRYIEAEEFDIEVLKLRREVLGEKHPDTIESMESLATTYHAQGRYNEAEELKIEVVQLRHDVLGEKHPDTIKSMKSLATTYHAQGRYNQAEELKIEVVQLRHEVLGEKHPDTIKSMKSLAATYRVLNKLKEADDISSSIAQLLLD